MRASKLTTALLLMAAVSLPAHAAEDRQAAFAKEVISGDSIRMKNGKILKYAGLEAPPLQHILPMVRKYGDNSLAFNKNLIEGKKIFIEWGPQLRDQHGRLLGYVFLEDGTCANLEILKSGNAKMRVQPPNLRYAEDFRKAELGARREKKGVWLEEPDNPFLKSEYIGNKNTRYYYFPTSPELYGMPEAHLERFTSRVAAKAAGYRACPACNEGEGELY